MMIFWQSKILATVSSSSLNAGIITETFIYFLGFSVLNAANKNTRSTTSQDNKFTYNNLILYIHMLFK